MIRDNLLVVVASLIFVISIGGLFSTYGSLVDLVRPDLFTGYVTDGASINLTVDTSASLNLTTDEVSWGSGSVDAGETNATIDTEGNIVRGNWTALSEGLVALNNGNVDIRLDLSSNKNSTEFLGGTNPSYKYKVTNVDSGACTPPAEFVLGTYYEINSTAVQVCSTFTKDKSVRIDFKLVIPSNSEAGILSSTITAGYEEA